MQLNNRSRVHAGGFTLVELMISIVIGMIVIGAVLGLVFANLQNTTTVTRGIRATQESRALTEILTRELLRSGYDGNGMTKIGSGTTGTTFTGIDTSTAGCIKYAYDADGDGATDPTEFRMFSRTVLSSGRGVVRYGQFANAGAVSCTGGNVITSDDIDVLCFRFRRGPPGGAWDSNDPDACFVPAPSTAVPLPAIPAGNIYFSMNLSTTLDKNGTATRRTDGVITLR